MPNVSTEGGGNSTKPIDAARGLWVLLQVSVKRMMLVQHTYMKQGPWSHYAVLGKDFECK